MRDVFRRAICGAAAAVVAMSAALPAWAAPKAVDVDEPRLVDERAGQVLELSGTPREKVVCFGDGTSGPRIEAFHLVPDTHVRPTPTADLRRAVAKVSSVVEESARRHGGDPVTPRFVHDADCYPKITRIVVPASVLSDYDKTLAWAEEGGLADDDRKYLLFVDLDNHPTCGRARFYADTRPGEENLNNATYSWAYVTRRCWNHIETHEIFHMLGAVLEGAPNRTVNAHCTDEYDIMCYVDGSGQPMHQVCPKEWDHLLDCGGDDYFNPNPEPGSWLDTHWNTYNSRFLAPGSGPVDTGDDSDPGDGESGSEKGSTGKGGGGSDRGGSGKGTGGGEGGSTSNGGSSTSRVSFVDTKGNVFASDIAALATSGIAKGCNPPRNDRYCPDQVVTRGQMAAFLVRALGLAAGQASFSDTKGHVFSGDVAALANAGITKGCNPPQNTRFCPDEPVTRGQMAAFLVRAGLAD